VSRVVRWRIVSIPDSAGASACDGNIAQAVSDVVPGMANVGIPRECSRRVVGPGLWLPWAPLMRAVIRVGISLGRSCSKPQGGKCASAGKQGRRDDPLGSRCGLHLVILHSLPTPRRMALSTPCTSRLDLHMGNFPHVCVIEPPIPICSLGSRFELAQHRSPRISIPCSISRSRCSRRFSCNASSVSRRRSCAGQPRSERNPVHLNPVRSAQGGHQRAAPTRAVATPRESPGKTPRCRDVRSPASLLTAAV
jgi:hypothetical protein